MLSSFWESVASFISNMDLLYNMMIVYASWEIVVRKNWKAILWLGILTLILQYSLNPIRDVFKIPAIYGKAKYGFPSGHLYWFAVLYGWMAFMLRTALSFRALKGMVWALYLLGLGLICAYTVDHGYHTWADVLSGVVFGWILLWTVLAGTSSCSHVLGVNTKDAF